ncbi:hypothetical protein ACYZUD_01795 [Pseudomonas sp. XS1P51]
MCDIPTGLKLHGQAISDAIDAFANAFPDVHRELLNIDVAENVVVVELAIRGTHKGELTLASEAVAPTGKAMVGDGNRRLHISAARSSEPS